jgi:hypothetical protein
VLHANTLEFLGLTFRDVVTRPLYRGTTLSFSECQARAYGGTITGTIDLDVKEAVYSCRLEVREVAIGTIMREFGGNNAGVAGTLAGWIELTVPAGKPEQMHGKGELTITKGSMVQLPLLANLLIGDPSGHKGQDSLTARFEFRDGQAQVLDARLMSPAASIFIHGAIGFDGDLRLFLVPKFKFDLVDQFPGLGPLVAPLLSSVTSRVARALVRGQVTKPVLVINPFMRE